MKKILAVLVLAGGALIHAQHNPPNHVVGTKIGVNFPAAASAPNQFWMIYNGASSSDCVTGGGTTAVLCYSNGSSWTAVSGGGGGSGTVTSVLGGSPGNGILQTALVPTQY